MIRQHETHRRPRRLPTARTGSRRVAALVLGIALVAASGCGARWDDEQRAAVLAARQSGGPAARSSSTATGRASAQTAAGGPAAAAGQAAAGDPAAVAAGGPAAAGPDAGAAAVAKPCAAPSDAPGVSADTITLGSINTLSGPVPGLGGSALAALRAFIEYRNASGGVCGRQLALKSVDDGMDNGRYRAALNDLNSQVIGIAGGLGGGDAGGVDVAESNKIPIVSFPISTEMQNVSTVFDINPPVADLNAVIGKYRYLRDQGVNKAALVYIAADQTRAEARDKQKPQMIAAGMQIVYEQELPLSTLSFDSAARGVANSGADYLYFVSDSSQSASMAKSMRDTGYALKFEEYITSYGTNFTELAGAAADGTSAWLRTLPNEEPGTSPEQDAYLSWMGQVAPDTPPDLFSADSWSAVKAFVDALDALPGPITREALVAQLKSVGDYDAGGLLGPIQLGPKLSKSCYIGMKVVSGKWQRFTPGQGFLC